MLHLLRLISTALIILLMFPCATLAAGNINIPILVYHNLNPVKPGSMNLKPQKLEAQLQWIKQNGYTIVPLKDVVAYLEGKRNSLPAKAVVVTADDGWESDYTYLFPIVKKYHIPVTLFIYPGTISEGKHALTWAQLKEMQQTGLFDIQDHTYTHPNFKQMKKRLSPDKFQAFVTNELVNSKKVLEDKLGIKVTLLAWPFGIYNDYLEQQAAKAGYEMAFSIDAVPANRTFKPMAQPRFMIIDALSAKTFTTIIKEANSPGA